MICISVLKYLCLEEPLVQTLWLTASKWDGILNRPFYHDLVSSNSTRIDHFLRSLIIPKPRMIILEYTHWLTWRHNNRWVEGLEFKWFIYGWKVINTHLLANISNIKSTWWMPDCSLLCYGNTTPFKPRLRMTQRHPSGFYSLWT